HRQPVAVSRAVPPVPAAAARALESVPGPGPLGAAKSSAPGHEAPKAAVTPRPQAERQPGSLIAWSREQLAEIERQLLPLVGPVARILVRDAAATTASRQELYQLLAAHLQTAEERRQFLLSGERVGTGPGVMPSRVQFGPLKSGPLKSGPLKSGPLKSAPGAS